MSLPVSTYRVQFNAGFTFADARAIIPYLARLGISHVYASSYLRAVPGSLHGYDVADPRTLNPELGTEQDFHAWVDDLRARGMGHILDVVPNHMGIARSSNAWWLDVLENGPSSRYASFFDIDWHPIKDELEHKVLLPMLGDAYGSVLERQEIQLAYEEGRFTVRYYETRLPIAPRSYVRILEHRLGELLADGQLEPLDADELQSIITALRRLPSQQTADPSLLAERAREKEVVKRRLAQLTARTAPVRAFVEGNVRRFNGTPGEPESFDLLDQLLNEQAYRLAHWRVAAEEINYRRFFDVNELAAIRVEDPEVFDAVHALVFRLARERLVDGFRVDHVDGLYDPADYVERLRARTRELTGDPAFYLVVEKILAHDEPLPDWPVQGTTGYDYLNVVNGLFVDGANERAVDDVYTRFVRPQLRYRDLVYYSKRLVMQLSMASDINVLGLLLNRFSERNRHYRDFTLNALTRAIREIIACFPVYRSYVTDHDPEVSPRDRSYIERAVNEAKRRNPGTSPLVFNFVRDVLLKQADYIPPSDRGEYVRFLMKFQQITSPVTAKGIEDTALYIYTRLTSLNEVGGEPDHFGVPPDTFHAWMQERAGKWPHAMSTTSTHDTKRSEDVRARIDVLSELPGAWKQAAQRWARMNRRFKQTLDGVSFPEPNEEYLLYQTLVGTWPFEPMDGQALGVYRERIQAYMEKALREAKVHSTWLNPSEPHEQALKAFVANILASSSFRARLAAFAARVGLLAIHNSLAQLVIKLTAPGVPDFYQGTELFDFSLVDPDNRRAVDYARRMAMLEEIDAAVGAERASAVAARLLASRTDGRVKLFLTRRLLETRRRHAGLFSDGGYEPLAVTGARRDRVVAFARRHGAEIALTIVPRLVATLLPDEHAVATGDRWGDTAVVMPQPTSGCFEEAVTGETVCPHRDGERVTLRVAEALKVFPVAVLMSAGG